MHAMNHRNTRPRARASITALTMLGLLTAGGCGGPQGTTETNAAEPARSSAIVTDGCLGQENTGACHGGYRIDGTLPDVPSSDPSDPNYANQMLAVADLSGNSSELGPINASGTKIGVINRWDPTTQGPMLGFTNPNASVDLTSVYMNTNVVGNDAWLYLAWKRESAKGSGIVAFEFQQDPRPAACDYSSVPTVPGKDPPLPLCNPWGNRKAGDFLLIWDTNGGGTPVVTLRTFTGDPGSKVLTLGPPKTLDTSSGIFAVPSSDGLGGEAALNMTTAVFATNQGCFSVSNIIVATVTGNSDTADFKDTVLDQKFATGIKIQSCGSVKVTKQMKGLADQSQAPAGTFEFSLAKDSDPIQYDGSSGVEAIPSPLKDTVSLPRTKSGDFYTNEKTLDNIVPGLKFSLSETKLPDGWTNTAVTCSTPGGAQNVDVKGGGQFEVKKYFTTTCTITNDQLKGTISIHKEDDAGTPMKDIVFTLYTDNAPTGGTSGHGDEDTATSYTCKTAENTGNCSMSGVLVGEYWIVETTGDADHDLAADQHVSITNDALSPAAFKFVNNRKKGTVAITKKDDLGNYLSGVEFTLYLDVNGAKGGATTSKCTTGTTGKCSITDVPYGTYFLVETTPPDANYYQAAADQTVTIDGTHTTVSLTIENKVLRGAILIQKYAYASLDKTLTKPLDGATFKIFDAKNDLYQTGVSGSALSGSGVVCIAGVPLVNGPYTIAETLAPTGYSFDATPKGPVIVTAGTDCGANPPAAQVFYDTPLSDLTLSFKSEAGTGVTVATVTCKDAGGNVLGSSGTWSFSALLPGTYTCTIEIGYGP